MSDEMKWGQPGREPEQTPPHYGHYQLNQPSQGPRLNGTEEPPKKKRNKSGRSFAATVGLAVVFGLVAGVVFEGVQYVSDTYLEKETKQETPLDTTAVLSEAGQGENSNMEHIIAENGTVAGVAQAAMPSVVAITSVSIQEIPSFFGYGFGGFGYEEYPSTGSGSGIIVGENDNELLIATNNHVVEGATTLSVCFIGNDVVNAEAETANLASGDGDINVEDAVSAKIKGTDPDNDLAVVSVDKSDIPSDTMDQIKIAQIGSSDDLMVGEQVVAIGNALGYGQSVTSGWISALNRSVEMDSGTTAELIQTDAAINPGNSGGALLNLNGELIGINSAKYADNAVEGMGYAIPISKAQPILEELMNRKTRDKVEESKAAYLGITPADLTATAIQMYNMPAGVFITDVARDGAAERAGICTGDIIVKLDGQKVSGTEDLADHLQYYTAGETVDIVISRADSGEYKEQTVQVILDSRPS